MTRWFLLVSRRPLSLPIALLLSALLSPAHAHAQRRDEPERDDPLRPQQDWEPPPRLERSEAPASATTARTTQAPAPRVSAEQLRAAMQRYASEPSVQRVIEAALVHAPKPRARALASRARTAGWVPTVALRARRGQGVDLSHALADEALELSTDDDLTLEAALTFELDRVVFRSEEVALARREQDEADARAARVRSVIALYFERRRLQLERDLAGGADPRRTTRIAELEALLDVFTNGAFGRMIAAARWKTGVNTTASRSRSQRSSTPAATR